MDEIQVAENCILKNSLRLFVNPPKNYRESEWQGIALDNVSYKLKSYKEKHI